MLQHSQKKTLLFFKTLIFQTIHFILTSFVLLFIGFYRLIMKPLFLGGGCRFQLTCSAYTLKVLKRFDLKKGLLLAGRRLSRCHYFNLKG